MKRLKLDQACGAIVSEFDNGVYDACGNGGIIRVTDIECCIPV